jgi:hypothetical protein
MKIKGIQNLTEKQMRKRFETWKNLMILIWAVFMAVCIILLCNAAKNPNFKQGEVYKSYPFLSFRGDYQEEAINYYLAGSFIKAISPAEYILEAEVLGMMEEDIYEKISWCESSNNPLAKNPNSTARGLFQIIKSSEEFCENGLKKQLDMFDPKDNRECAEYLMANGGTAHWEESRHCWSNL